MEVKAHIPLITMNAAAAPDGSPRGIIASNKTDEPHRPDVPWRGPEAGDLRKYSNFSWTA